MNQSVLTKNQKKTETVFYREGGFKHRMIVTLRFDDECGNGHNSFAITADVERQAKNNRWVWQCGGCCHDDIAKHCKKYVKYIKWHLFDTRGHMHYIANTLWHAGDEDCHGDRPGEKHQMQQGKTGLPMWRLQDHPLLNNIQCTSEKPTPVTLNWEPCYHDGPGGKERDFDAARACAVWPEATDEDLMSPDLEEKLRARLPNLLAEFRADMEELGFTW